MDYNSLLELVQKRRSTRVFKPIPIPDEYVNKIIEVARWAPSGGNSQPWEFIVVKKKEERESIVNFFKEQSAIVGKAEQAREPEKRFFSFKKLPQNGPPKDGTPPFAAAPVLIIVCGDPRTKEAYPFKVMLDRGQPHFYSGLAITFLYMHLAAATLGLGSQWVSASAMDLMQSRLKELLGIPLNLEIYDMMAVGYPAIEPNPRLVRSMDEIVHYDHYDKTKYRTDEQVTEFISVINRR
jgi:nitroreductase